ncbi:uncharacterized protein [Solanum lycopersicum]|uniref:uncharacterized protein n=1 Tax=Solanum lycopersicum TaxID=4081 RepID=UPI0037486918
MTSNIAESLNNVNRLARWLPVISLLEFMRVTIQSWIHKHNEEADKTTSDLTKNMIFIYRKVLRCRVIPSTVDLHAVAEGAKKYILNLNTRMCSCGGFQHYDIPCGHAIAVLWYRKLHEADFYSAFYSLKNFKDAYAIPVEPIPCKSAWDIPSYISEPKMIPPCPKKISRKTQI